MASEEIISEEKLAGPRKHTLGTVHLRDNETNETILVPTPSNDPNDPLNWGTVQKYYIFGIICAGVFMVNFTSVGPSVALELITREYFGDGPDFLSNLSKVSYTQTACSLMIGVGNLIWVPLAIKYGRRPVYIAAFLLFTACTIWCGVAKTFASQLAGRIILGTAAAAPEIVAPLSLTDIFFLHQRGTIMVIYTCALSCGVGAGVVFSGLITMHHSWRVIYWLCTAANGFLTLLIIFTFPETHFRRQDAIGKYGIAQTPSQETLEIGKPQDIQLEESASTCLPRKKTFIQAMGVFSGSYTQESIFTLAFRPIIALFLPAVLWATLINSITIGMIVVLSSNFSTAFSTVYGFKTWQSGLTFISTIIGSLIAIFSGGHLSDWVADKLTKRNGGIRTPEMRLPTLTVSLVTGPLSCILYGVGIGKQLHWICAVFGIGLVNFTTVQSNNISLVYILDSYRPISGEVVVAQAVFKAAFSFLLSFYVNPWIQEEGYISVFGTLAGISAAIFICWIPFYFFGNYFRLASWKWGFVMKTLHWHPDREVGE